MPASKHSETDMFIMRHAATTWNLAGRIQGQQDAPLALEGKQQIAFWQAHVDRLKPGRLCSSDLGRAVQTANGLSRGRGLPLTTDPRLREQDWGRWTGRIHRRLKAECPHEYARQQAKGWDFRPPGGESQIEVLARGLAVLRDLAGAHPGDRVLVVTHEGVLKCLVYHLAIRDGCGLWPGTMAPYHVHQLGVNASGVFLKKMNAVDLNHRLPA